MGDCGGHEANLLLVRAGTREAPAQPPTVLEHALPPPVLGHCAPLGHVPDNPPHIPPHPSKTTAASKARRLATHIETTASRHGTWPAER